MPQQQQFQQQPQQQDPGAAGGFGGRTPVVAGAHNSAHHPSALEHLQRFGPTDLPHALKKDAAIKAAKAEVSFLDQIEHPEAVRDFHLVRERIHG